MEGGDDISSDSEKAIVKGDPENVHGLTRMNSNYETKSFMESRTTSGNDGCPKVSNNKTLLDHPLHTV